MRFSLLYFFSLLSSLVYSQFDSLDYNPYYIQKYEENFYPYTFVNAREYDLQVYENAKNEYTSYRPDAKSSIGFGLDYKWMTLAYSFTLARKRNEESRNVNFAYGVTRRKLRVAFLYQDYKGFSQVDVKNGNEDTLSIYRPNFENRSFNLVGFYIPKGKKASYRGSFLYFEKQLRSSGSFTFGGAINYATLRAKKSLIPSQHGDSTLPVENRFRRASNVNVGIAVGGFYTFVLSNRFHFSSYLSLDLYYDVDLEGKDFGPLSSNNKFGSGVDFQFLLGYDNDKIFSGITLKGSSYSKVGLDNTFGTNYALLEFYLGKRFNLQFNKNKRFINFK